MPGSAEQNLGGNVLKIPRKFPVPLSKQQFAGHHYNWDFLAAECVAHRCDRGKGLTASGGVLKNASSPLPLPCCKRSALMRTKHFSRGCPFCFKFLRRFDLAADFIDQIRPLLGVGGVQ